MKFDGNNVIAWDRFSRNDTLIQMKETMDGFEYCNILLSRILPFTNEKMPRWSFRRDSDLERPTELIKTFLLEQNVNMIKRSSQSPDLNRIEHLWDHVRRPLGVQSYTNKGELMHKITKIWCEIWIAFCVRLVESMARKCHVVIEFKDCKVI